MIAFFIMAFIVSLFTRILFGVYVCKVSVFASLLTPLTWVTVMLGILALIFLAIKIYKDLKK